MEITKEQVAAVFSKWNKECLESPDCYNQNNPTLENVESYSEDQANDFMIIFKELNP